MSSKLESFYFYIFSPLKSLIGYFSDLIPFNLGLSILSVLIGLSIFSLYKIIKYKSYFYYLPLGIIGFILFQAIAIQMAENFILFPSWYRNLKANLLTKEFLDTEALINFSKSYLTKFNITEFNNLSDQDLLKDANQSLDLLFEKLSLSKGRQIRRIKDFYEPFFSIGLAYGGPAYHDPFTQEIVIPNRQRYPTSRFWYIHAIYHETAHAKGFLNELDTTLLQLASMFLSKYQSIQALAAIHILINSNQYYQANQAELLDLGIPKEILTDFQNGNQNLKQLLAQKKVYLFLKSLMQKIEVQNSPKKYGYDPNAWQKNPLTQMLANLLANKLLEPENISYPK